MREQLNLSLDEETLRRLDLWRDGTGAKRPGAAVALLVIALDVLDYVHETRSRKARQ